MNIICRDSIIEKLQNYYGTDIEYEVQYPPVIFIYGNQSTGKTLALKKFFELSSISHTFINCQEYNSIRGLLEAIINRSEWLAPESGEYCKIDSVYSFMDRLMDANCQESFVIVLDNAENLRNIDMNLMRMFFNLQQNTGLNVSLVLISQLPFEKFHSKSGDLRPNIIHFQSYTKEEIVQILTKDFGKMLSKGKGIVVDERASEEYIQIILSVFYKACKDLTELKFVCMKYWDVYWQPVLQAQIDESDTQKLWRNISKSLKTGLSILYQRTIEEPNKNDVPVKIKVVDLPYYTKGLLVAAFLASYNPLKNDKRLFVKHHGKQTKRLQTVNKNAVNFDRATLTLGPKTFTVDRLLAIFCAILDEKVGITTNLISQISTLVNLRYLTYVSGENNLIDGAGRLQCNITQEKATQLSCNIGIDIKKYISAF